MSTPLSRSSRPTKRAVGSAGRPSARRACGAVVGGIGGAEAVDVDAARHDADAVGVRAVDLHQEDLLVRRGADHAIGARDDAALGVDAQGGLAFGAAGAVLDLAQGVEHRDVGAAPVVGQGHAGDRGDPVVGVNKVVGRAVAGGLGVLLDEGLHAGAELGFHGVHVERGEGRGRAGADVDDAHVAIEGHDGGQGGIVAAGEDVDAAAGSAEPPGEGVDVDVHAPGLGRARHGQRRGMGAEEGEALQVVRHQAVPPSAGGRCSTRRVTGVGFAPSWNL